MLPEGDCHVSHQNARTRRRHWSAGLGIAPGPPPKEPQQNRPGSEPPVTKQVRGNLYQVSGGVANAFFYVAPDEVLVVDAKMTPEAARGMLAEVQQSHRQAGTPRDSDS